MNRRRGQAAIELVAVVPLLILASLVAWQLAAVTWAALQSQHQLVQKIEATPAGVGTHVRLSAKRPVATILPGVDGLSVTAHAEVRRP